MTKRCQLKVMAGLIACLCVPAMAAGQPAPRQPLSVAICDDENELPPFSFFERQPGRKAPLLSGFAVSIVREIFTRRNVNYTIDVKPWARCIALVTRGREYAMLMNLTHSVEREASFLYSRPFASGQSYYYYAKDKYPNGLSINSMTDLRHYRVCGIAGHNYREYGMAAGDVDQGARNLEIVLSKLKRGRCTLFLEKDDIMAGYATQGKPYYPDAAIGKAPVPGMKPSPFHFGISKRHPRAEELRQLIDEELLLMEASGRLAELWKIATTPPSR